MNPCPFPLILCTFSHIYRFHFVTTVVLHKRSSHLRDSSHALLRSSWPQDGTSTVTFFFSVFWLLSLKIMFMLAFFSQLHSSFHLFHCSVFLHFLCWVVFFHITHYTLHITLLPSTFLHVKSTLSCDAELLGYCLQKELLKCITSWIVFSSQSKVDLFFHFILNNLHKMEGWNQYNNMEVKKKKKFKKNSTLYQFSI